MAGGKKNDAWDEILSWSQMQNSLVQKLLSAMYWEVLAFLQSKVAKRTEAFLVYGANKTRARQLGYISCMLRVLIDIFHNYNETTATSEMNTDCSEKSYWRFWLKGMHFQTNINSTIHQLLSF